MNRSRHSAPLGVVVQRALLRGLIRCTLYGIASLASADPQRPLDDVARGGVLAGIGRCQGCHGEDGDSLTPVIPKLAGQHASYLLKQLRDFKSGARKHEIMSVMAADIADADLGDIAAFFASRPALRGEKLDSAEVAKNLFVNGDPKRNILSCASCHGSDGRGLSHNGITYPSIAGQHRKYLRAQMVKWSLDERSNSEGGVMNHIAKALSGQEIEALSAYAAGL